MVERVDGCGAEEGGEGGGARAAPGQAVRVAQRERQQLVSVALQISFCLVSVSCLIISCPSVIVSVSCPYCFC